MAEALFNTQRLLGSTALLLACLGFLASIILGMYWLFSTVKGLRVSGLPAPLVNIADFVGMSKISFPSDSKSEYQYSPSSTTPHFREIISEYRRLGEIELGHHGHIVHRYGGCTDEVIVLGRAVAKSEPVHVFIHGGYWQELSWRDAFFAARGFSAAGVTYGALNYSLAPKLTLSAIVEQCRRAVAALSILSRDVGGNGRISLSGSSAGAHLVAMLTMTRWSDFGLSQDPIAAIILVSGIYDLEPLVKTTINAPLQLSRAEARRMSPLRMNPLGRPPSIVCWGEHETEAFKWQSGAFAHHLSRVGADVQRFEVPGRNHFDILFDLSDPTTALGSATLGLIQKTR